MGVLESIVGAGAGIVQSFIEGRQQRRNIDMQNAANKQLAEYQYSKQLEMWNRQNEYNSPKNQMERFGAAGLNPNLIYGQGNAGNATQLPRYEAPQLSYNYKPMVDLPSTLGLFQDFQIKQAQVDNLKSQNKVLEAEAKIRGAKAGFASKLEEARTKKEWEEMFGARWRQLEDQNYFTTFFEPVGMVNGMQKWAVKPEAEEAVIENFSFRMRKPFTDYERTQADILKTKVDTELQSKNIDWYVYNRLGAAAIQSVDRLLKGGVKGRVIGQLRGTNNILRRRR